MTDTSTLTLTEFLLARVAEDEQTVADLRYTPRTHRDRLADPSDPMYANLTRALAECEAKRRIVEDEPARGASNRHSQWERTLRTLAIVYADHPDYNPDWRP